MILSFILGMGCMAFVSCGKDGGEVNENGGSEKGASQSASASVEEEKLPVKEENQTPEEDLRTGPCEWDDYYFKSFTDFQDFYGVFKKTHPGKLVSINFDGVECESRRYRYVGDAMYQPTDELGFREFTFAFVMEVEYHLVCPTEPGVTADYWISDGFLIEGESFYAFSETDFSIDRAEIVFNCKESREGSRGNILSYKYNVVCANTIVMSFSVDFYEDRLDEFAPILEKINAALVLM